MPDFVHLHLHTQYSLLDGAIRFDRLFNAVNEFKMPACAITDHGNMFGAAQFYLEAGQNNIKPIIGCEAYIAPRSRHEQKKIKGEDTAYHVVLLAMNNTGYQNLLKLISLAHLEGFYYHPRIDREILTQYHEGLICLTACIKGEIPNSILRGDDALVRRNIDYYLGLFGDRLFFELQDNGLDSQKIVNERLVELSSYYNVPIVATNDCHYLRREEHKAHELLLCIGTGKTINDKDRLSFSSDQFYFKSPEEIALAFSRYPEALSNTVRVAEMCNVTIDMKTYHFPEFHPPAGMDLNEHFEELSREGFMKRMPEIRSRYDAFGEDLGKRYEDRFNYEVGVIKNTGFAGYFLIVADFINYAKTHSIPVGPGRGSAAGSLIAYCLGITDIEPIKYDLIFERFLNPERISMPDIDVDFCRKGRDEVIQYVTEKYGRDNVAQITTFGTMQSKAAVRDIGRALGMPYAEVDKIAKLITSGDRGIERAIKEEPQVRELYETDERVRELLDNATVVEGLARHASTHAAGIVIANKHLSEYLPLYRGKHDETVTQYDMKMIEKIGLIKIDFLGLETLTLMDTVVKLLKEEGIDIDLTQLPLDDKKTYDLLSSGNTSGVFQLESRGMRDLLTRLKPSQFDDIMPLIALYRPGPLKSGMVDEFIKRRNDPTQITYETPKLREILHDTYGVIIYQEQIMKIASVLAGFSMKDADALRKAMSKKIPEQLEMYKQQFVDGSVANSVPKDVAEKIYDVIQRFGEYGFNKSHSTAYGYIAYQTAYLKAHYPIHYFAAMLTTEVGDTDKLVKYIGECRESGIEILPPDINMSQSDFTIVDAKIRYGLSGIRNVGEAAIVSIIQAREEAGGFKSFVHFCGTIDSRRVNKKVIESLACAGCFDSLGLKRSQVLYLAQEMLDKLTKRDTKANLNQGSIFGESDVKEATVSFDIPAMDELAHDEILNGEKEALGFYFSKHPLKPFEKLIAELTPHDSQTLKEANNMEDVDVAGVVSTLREITTKKGGRMAYVNLEDTKGVVEVIFFPDLYGKQYSTIQSGKPLMVSGSLEKADEGSAKIRAKGVVLLESLTGELLQTVKITVNCEVIRKDELRVLKDILVSTRGRSAVLLEFRLNGECQSVPVRNIKIDPKKKDVILKHFKKGIDVEVIDEILP